MYRASADQHYSEREPLLVAALAPHLREAFRINCGLHVERVSGIRGEYAAAIRGVRGVLAHGEPPFAALIRDADHLRVVAWMRGFRGRLLTTWPVLTEVCHFLTAHVTLRFLKWVERGGVTVIQVSNEELSSVIRLMEKYLDQPMDLADASLVWLGGQSGVRDILTLDTRDLSVFRAPRGKPFVDLLAEQRQPR